MFETSTSFLGDLPMFQMSTISRVHTNVRNVHQFLSKYEYSKCPLFIGYMQMCETSTSFLVTYQCSKCPLFLGYIQMFETSTSSLVTYQCSKCALFFWYIRMFETSTSFLSTYEVRAVQFLWYVRTFFCFPQST
jgi:hypothetical protein